MQITQIKSRNKGKTFTPMTLEALVSMIREGEHQQTVRDYRTMLLTKDCDDSTVDVKEHCQIPSVCFAALWRKSGGLPAMKEYNALVMLEITNLPNAEEVRRIRVCAAQIPYTRLTFVGASGRDVVVVCAIAHEDLSPDVPEERIRKIHLAAYRMLHYLYSSQLMLSVDNREPLLDSTCLLSTDSEAYYNPVSEPYIVTDEDVQVPLYKGARGIAEPSVQERASTP